MLPKAQMPRRWLLACCLGLASVCASGAINPPATTGHRNIISQVTPIYPEIARRMHVTGTVTLRISIQPNGTVSDAHIESGHPLLLPAALNAVLRWRFAPSSETTVMSVGIAFTNTSVSR